MEFFGSNTGQDPGANKFCSWASENRRLLAEKASEIRLSGLVSLSENVSLINDTFLSGAISCAEQ